MGGVELLNPKLARAYILMQTGQQKIYFLAFNLYALHNVNTIVTVYTSILDILFATTD